ncbi:EamA family transporter [Mesobacillus subterraneus]|uniref:DMT family transporter n=1 Tax=Mesobacillus subterraneus TaxID=285983 RepID=UPI0020424BC9|nr:EamA family transporter [Mesobacillus subterraneus]MCM3573933.1 EamA family transporter [Mesobacillus subterraneus]
MDIRMAAAHLLVILLWGSAFAGIRHGLEGYSPEHLSFLRLLVGSLALFCYAVISKMKLPEIKDWPVIFLFGFLGFAVYQTALNFGEQTVSAGAASLLVSTSPVFIGLLGKMFNQERTGKWYWSGALISMAGIVLISFGAGGGFELGIGVLLILIASLSESLYFVFQKNYLEKYGALPFTAYTIWAATIFMGFFAPGIGSQIAEAPLGATISAIYLGLFPTVVAYFAIAFITAQSGASEAASSLYLTPAASFIIAWIWLGEVPAIITLAGGVITLIGVSLTYLKGRSEMAGSSLEIKG